MNEVWAGDVTYIATTEGWAYLAILPYLYSRRVVGWALSSFYRIRSFEQASRTVTKMTSALAHSSVRELITFRSTRMRWRQEILAYFRTRATNGITEGSKGKGSSSNAARTATGAAGPIDSGLLNACA